MLLFLWYRHLYYWLVLEVLASKNYLNYFTFKIGKTELSMVVRAYNPNTLEIESEGSQVLGQSGP
jgi:hypothetical protein